MKTRIFLYQPLILFACIALFANCSGHEPGTGQIFQPEKADTTSVQAQSVNLIRGDSVKGDFNGDGKQEYAWTEHDDSGPGNCAIAFSNKMLPRVELGKDLYGGKLMNQGDLDDNGTEEFSVVPYGDAGEWSNCSLYSFVKEKWAEALKSFAVYGSEDDYIEKDPVQKNVVIITEFSYTEKSGISSVHRSVKLFEAN
ncbi:MAG: hypothetical protein JWO44_118 [Bacteroidetes bacterium]|nr:hypothetical protein [Bacteroidota bacterium]